MCGTQVILYIRACQRSRDGYFSRQQPVIETSAMPLPILLINQAGSTAWLSALSLRKASHSRLGMSLMVYDSST